MTLPYLTIAWVSGIYLQSVLPPESPAPVFTLSLAAATTLPRARRWQVRPGPAESLSLDDSVVSVIRRRMAAAAATGESRQSARFRSEPRSERRSRAPATLDQ